MGSPQTRARTHVPWIGRRILNHCATGEARELFSSFEKVTSPEWLVLWESIELWCSTSLGENQLPARWRCRAGPVLPDPGTPLLHILYSGVPLWYGWDFFNWHSIQGFFFAIFLPSFSPFRVDRLVSQSEGSSYLLLLSLPFVHHSYSPPINLLHV